MPTINTYVPPGTYLSEAIVPSALSINTVPQTVAIVGSGNVQKRAQDEAVVRGGITLEVLTVSAVPGAHTATLAHVSTQRQNDSSLFINGVLLDPSLWSFTSTTVVLISDNAFILGATYTFTYIATDTDRDPLVNRNTRTAVRVGSFAGTSTFTENIDYQLDTRARLNGPINDTYDLSVNNQLYLQVNGLAQITILVAGAAPATSTAAEVVADINAALVASGTYGPAFGNVAEVYNGDQVRLTSPTQGSTSQIRINTGALNSAGAIFGVTVFPFIAESDVIDWSVDQAAELVGTVVSPFNLAAASVLNVAFDTLVDGAVQAEWSTLAVGPYNVLVPNNNVRLNIDARGNIDIAVTGGVAQAAAVIAADINAALLASPTYGAAYGTVATVVGGTRLRFTSPTTGAGSSMEFGVPTAGTFPTTVLEIDATQLPLRQLGDGTVACRLDVGGAITIAAIIADINARFADHSRYGATFSTVAQNDGANRLRLLSPIQGVASKVRISAALTASAHTVVLGLTTAQLLFTALGTGNRPGVGTVYFATYDFVRPTADYNTPIRVFSQDEAFRQVGDLATNNPLAIAAQIAFENDAPSIFLVQVNDSNGDGAYSIADFQTAINTGLNNSGITDVIVLDTRLDVQSTLLNHTVNSSSITAKRYRRGWFGMARNTNVGDIDTAETLIFRAKRTLQVAADSPGRGRFILTAPPNVSKTLTLSNGTQPLVNLDSTFLAVAVAARHTSFTDIATSLLRKLVTGFDLTTFQTYLDSEFNLLAPAGVNVVVNDAGRLVLKDPITTETGGGGLISFAEISAGAQKDNTVRAVTQAVDANLVGIVPEDLSDFIQDVKTVVGTTLQSLISSGAIGPFRDEQGRTRDINYASDIQVFQSSTNQTTFTFRFAFNLRYPAKRFFGEFVVDNPLVSVAGSTVTA